MPSEPEGAHDPFAGFVVETERMPDGRLIHYYEWPSDPDAPEPEGGVRQDSAKAGGDV